jgi:excisionase family DNA binding protein
MSTGHHSKFGERAGPGVAGILGFDPAEITGAPEYEPVVDSREAARFLNINAKTIQKLARNREVPAYRIGKLWKFRISDLDGWLRSRVISSSHSCRENERR